MIAKHKNVRILLSLLKQYDIRHIVISPGSRNMPFVKSVEDDPFFTCYSVVDERSAAYFAVGVSLEVRAPVVISSTSGQATRNYFPGMTEAYYRKAPLLVVTTDYDEVFTGQQNMQSVRQMEIPSDAANVSVDIPIIKDKSDDDLVTRRVNEALDALTRNGGGPAHVNLRIGQHWMEGEDKLETVRKISRYLPLDEEWPAIGERKVLLVIGQHHAFSEEEARALTGFARKHDVAIYVSHISNYNGEKSVHGNLRLTVCGLGELRPDLLITIGGHLGDYPLDGNLKASKIEHWRVCDDGNFSDTYNSLTKVFECPEQFFFERMEKSGGADAGSGYYESWVDQIGNTRIPEDLPLTHALVARRLAPLLPEESNLHFAILSSLRFWEFFTFAPSIKCYSNVAGFGIDGDLSTFLGQSVVSDALNFLIIGDLAFFYDMNSIGIHHLKNNIRIVLVNNRGGGEFRAKSHAADQFGDNTNRHIAASGHFGDSAEGWVRSNHFKYLAAKTKDDLDTVLKELVSPSDSPVLLEVFTAMEDDASSLQAFIDVNDNTSKAQKVAQAIKGSIPDGLKKGIKKLIRK